MINLDILFWLLSREINVCFVFNFDNYAIVLFFFYVRWKVIFFKFNESNTNSSSVLRQPITGNNLSKRTKPEFVYCLVTVESQFQVLLHKQIEN